MSEGAASREWKHIEFDRCIKRLASSVDSIKGFVNTLNGTVPPPEGDDAKQKERPISLGDFLETGSINIEEIHRALEKTITDLRSIAFKMEGDDL